MLRKAVLVACVMGVMVADPDQESEKTNTRGNFGFAVAGFGSGNHGQGGHGSGFPGHGGQGSGFPGHGGQGSGFPGHGGQGSGFPGHGGGFPGHGGGFPGQGGGYPNQDGCRYWCRASGGRYYCCEGNNKPVGPVYNKPGRCPPVRPSCPPTRFAAPQTCSNDGSCSGTNKCCYDTCLGEHVCKLAQNHYG